MIDTVKPASRSPVVHSRCYSCQRKVVTTRGDYTQCQVCGLKDGETDLKEIRTLTFCELCLASTMIRQALYHSLCEIPTAVNTCYFDSYTDGVLKIYACQRTDGCWNKIRRSKALTILRTPPEKRQPSKKNKKAQLEGVDGAPLLPNDNEGPDAIHATPMLVDTECMPSPKKKVKKSVTKGPKAAKSSPLTGNSSTLDEATIQALLEHTTQMSQMTAMQTTVTHGGAFKGIKQENPLDLDLSIAPGSLSLGPAFSSPPVVETSRSNTPPSLSGLSVSVDSDNNMMSGECSPVESLKSDLYENCEAWSPTEPVGPPTELFNLWEEHEAMGGHAHSMPSAPLTAITPVGVVGVFDGLESSTW